MKPSKTKIWTKSCKRNPEKMRNINKKTLPSQKEGLKKLRAIADFQFGPNTGRTIFPERTKVEYSARTGRIRRAKYGSKVLATVLPSIGLLALTVPCARRFVRSFPPLKQRVVVEPRAERFVSLGRSVFAKHVLSVDPELRPGDETIVTDKDDKVLATGRVILSPEEMLSFNRGIAVKTRSGSRSSLLQ
ncbi:MAG: PUA domain-containing protein [Thermoproteota archaeon]